nr:hypothetical protein [uncultured Draconibacterium sp.]
MKDKFIIGGWTQHLDAAPPKSFSYAMYGMITNFPALTSGTKAQPGWSPAKTVVPQQGGCKVLWTYGGAGGFPKGTPASEPEIKAIIDVTNSQNWAGVDVDNESEMNIDNIALLMQQLKSQGKETSYTFLAGWSFNHEGTEDSNIKKLAAAGNVDRFILMCYAGAMWSMADIKDNVGQAIEKTISLGVDASKVILALTPAGLTQENLDYFLNQVTSHSIGGLFIWEYPSLNSSDLEHICTTLGI